MPLWPVVIPMLHRILSAAVLFTSSALFAGAVLAQRQPYTFFKERINFTEDDIRKVEQGRVVTKVLDSGDKKYGTLVVGAVYVDAPLTRFDAVVRDVKRLRENKVYLDLQEYSPEGTPPRMSDFERLKLSRKDLDALQHCGLGDCDLQVFDPESFRKQIDWDSNYKYIQANELARSRICEGMAKYFEGGLKAFGSYRDRAKPLDVYNAFKQMVDSSYYLPQDKSGGIYRHVIDYPQQKLRGASDIFYWEYIDFGRGPTIRVNHLSIFPNGAGAAKFVAANKQLYASRDIRMALQMFYCVPNTGNSEKSGFFLIEMNDSRLPDFSGIKLTIARKLATQKSVEATTDSLNLYRRWSMGN
jgi:hypothetical protein